VLGSVKISYGISLSKSFARGFSLGYGVIFPNDMDEGISAKKSGFCIVGFVVVVQYPSRALNHYQKNMMIILLILGIEISAKSFDLTISPALHIWGYS